MAAPMYVMGPAPAPIVLPINLTVAIPESFRPPTAAVPPALARASPPPPAYDESDAPPPPPMPSLPPELAKKFADAKTSATTSLKPAAPGGCAKGCGQPIKAGAIWTDEFGLVCPACAHQPAKYVPPVRQTNTPPLTVFFPVRRNVATALPPPAMPIKAPPASGAPFAASAASAAAGASGAQSAASAASTAAALAGGALPSAKDGYGTNLAVVEQAMNQSPRQIAFGRSEFSHLKAPEKVLRQHGATISGGLHHPDGFYLLDQKQHGTINLPPKVGAIALTLDRADTSATPIRFRLGIKATGAQDWIDMIEYADSSVAQAIVTWHAKNAAQFLSTITITPDSQPLSISYATLYSA